MSKAEIMTKKKEKKTLLTGSQAVQHLAPHCRGSNDSYRSMGGDVLTTWHQSKYLYVCMY